MRFSHYIILAGLMILSVSCNDEARFTAFVELSEAERAKNLLDSSPSRVLFGKVTFESDGSWSDGWIINQWRQVRELDMEGFVHHGMSDIMFDEQLNDMNDSSEFLYEIEDHVSLAKYYKKMELRFKGIKAEAGEAYFAFHIDQSGRFSSTGGSCNSSSSGEPFVVFDMSIISMNGKLANAPSAAECVQWLKTIDNDLR